MLFSQQDVRVLRCYEGIEMASGILTYNYDGLWDACERIKERQKDSVIPALSMCWEIIDQIHRIREIAQAVPGLSKKNSKLKKFLRRTSVIEDCRHYIQHLRTELLQSNVSYPVWGALSWISQEDRSLSKTIILGTASDANFSSSVYDTLEKKWVSNVTLAVKEKSINIDPLYGETAQFCNYLLPWLLEHTELEHNLTNWASILKFSVVGLNN